MNDTSADRGPDVIDEVLSDHEQIAWYLDQVTIETGTRKSEMFDQLTQYLEMHESAEQAVIHPQTKTLDDDVAADRFEEESEGVRMLGQLRAMGVDDPRFDGLFAEFREAVLRHARNEEREEHPKLRAAVGDERLAEMAREFLVAEQDAAIGNG
jgi:hemerythrin superfamily protein